MEKQKERLVELLTNGQPPFNPLNSVCIEHLAYHLLANGVIAPPCKVGDKVVTKHGNTFEIEQIEILKDKKIFRCGNPGTDDYMAFFEDEIGTYVSLKEETKQALGKEEGK